MLFHTIRTWFRTRLYRELWRSIPVILAGLAWLAFAAGLLSWRVGKIETAYNLIARRAMGVRNYETARVACQRLLSLRSEARDQHLFVLALALGGQGRDQEAAAIMTKVAPSDKQGYAPAQLYFAKMLLARTNATPETLQTAEQHLKRVLDADPKSVEANSLLGRLCLQTHQWERAKQHFMLIVPVQPEAALMLAALFKGQGDAVSMRVWAEQAEKYFHKRVQDASLDDSASRLSWVEALTFLESYADAFAALEAGARQSGNPVYQGPMGEVCAAWAQSIAKTKPGDWPVRIKLIHQGLQYAPQDHVLLTQFIELSRLAGAEANASRAALTRLLAEGQALPLAHFILGLDAVQHGQTERARSHFLLAYETTPYMVYVANNMAMILALGDKPDLPRALDVIRSVLDKYPENANLRDTRGRVLVLMGRWQEAVADLEFALPKLPAKSATHAALAKAYEGLGQKDQAAEHDRLAKQKPSAEQARVRPRTGQN